MEKEDWDNLLIHRGTLNREERKVIQNHAERSWRWLNELPFPKSKRAVPLYAGSHHESLDGSGYPNQLQSKQLPIQSRILAVADIFEALTASDRPYTPTKKLSRALEIFGDFVVKEYVDPEIARIFVQSDFFKQYVENCLKAEQKDVTPEDLAAWTERFVNGDFEYSLSEVTWSG